MFKRMALAAVAVLVWAGCWNSPSNPVWEHARAEAPPEDPVVDQLVGSPGELHNAVIEAYLEKRTSDGAWQGWDRFVVNLRDAVNEVLGAHGASTRITSEDVRSILEHHRRLAVRGIIDVTHPTWESLHRYVEFAADHGALSREAAAAEHRVIDWVRADGVRAALQRARRELAYGTRGASDPDFERFLDILDASDRLWSRYSRPGPDPAGWGDKTKRVGSKIIDSTVGLLIKAKLKSIVGNAVSSILFEEAWDWTSDHAGDLIDWPPPPCPTCFPCQPLPCTP